MDKYKLRTGSRRLRGGADEDEEGRSPLWHLYWAAPAAVVVLLVALWAMGVFRSKPPMVSTDPEGKLRLERLLAAYKLYCDKHPKGPPSEQALREFLQKAPQQDKDDIRLPDNFDDLLTSPRDGQKFEVKWGTPMDPIGGAHRAVIWEKTGQGGVRFVALANGYVTGCTEEDFNNLKK
jgi:hypothetical protein